MTGLIYFRSSLIAELLLLCIFLAQLKETQDLSLLYNCKSYEDIDLTSLINYALPILFQKIKEIIEKNY